VTGQWKRHEISTSLEIAQVGPESVYWPIGSSQRTAYLNRKLAAFWGTTIPPAHLHSTTVAGVANTWGYGAMTIHTTLRNARLMVMAAIRPKRTRVAAAHSRSKELNRAT